MPLAGHDPCAVIASASACISIHVPLAGHDLRKPSLPSDLPHNFNPRAPCGARLAPPPIHPPQWAFQSTCPLRGTTAQWTRPCHRQTFQSTCPLRGTTHSRAEHTSQTRFQSTCPLRGTTRDQLFVIFDPRFQSTCPLRGTTLIISDSSLRQRFQSTCPLRGTTVF